MRAVLGLAALLLVALAGWRVLVTTRRGATSGRWFCVLVAAALVGAAALLW